MSKNDQVNDILNQAVADAQKNIPSEEITQTEMLEILANSQRSPQYMQGRREAVKWAVTWLHDRANEMNDPHAKAVLDSAAFNMGADAKDGQLPRRS